MSTFSTQRQSKTITEHSAAPARRTNPNQTASASPVSTTSECPVLLRLPDVSRVSLEENFRQTTPLEMKSALESLGTDPASQTTSTRDTEHSASAQTPVLNSNEQAFASLLAASPAFHSTGLAGNSTGANVNTPVNQPVIPVRQATAEVSTASSSEAETESDESRQTATDSLASTKYHRRDKPTALPVRRSFRVYRPSWMPEVPPTLLLGVLICSTAVLIGMLWRSNKAEFQEVAVPAAQEDSQETPKDAEATPTPRVAEVPELPAKNAKPPLKTAKRVPDSKSPNKLSKDSSKEPAAKATDPAAALANQNAPKPEASKQANQDIHSLPPVESVPQENFYGQMLGGPPPHIVNNPHVGNPNQARPPAPGQGPIYEARRPAAEFRGMITKPDATDNHERY